MSDKCLTKIYNMVMNDETRITIRFDNKEIEEIKRDSSLKGQSVSAYIKSKVSAGKDLSDNLSDELKEFARFVDWDYVFDRLVSLSGKRSDKAAWARVLLTSLGDGVISQGNSPTDNKWEGWELTPNPDGEKTSYYSEHHNDNIIVIGKGTKTQVIKEGEDGWDYFINQIQ